MLVNNAGIFYNKPFTDYTVEDLDPFFGYLRGTFVLTQSAVQAMRQQPEGSQRLLVFAVARFPLAPVALEMIFESARMLAQLVSGSKCF